MAQFPHFSSSENTTLDECARRIEALVQRSSSFVRDQLERLRTLESSTAFAMQSECSTAEAEWHQDQAAWLQQRAQEEARIQEQLDHLAKVWRELEVEQRRLLLQGRTDHESTADRHDGECLNRSNRPQESLDLCDSSGSFRVTSAAFQFQRLKREIRQQTQRQH